MGKSPVTDFKTFALASEISKNALAEFTHRGESDLRATCQTTKNGTAANPKKDAS